MSLDFSDNPFVGLRPFETSESLLFFGRQAQTMEILQRLHQYHFVAITGGSGSGKSSLIKAGVIPRLKAGYLVNINDHWIISVMKPGQSPINNLVDAILDQFDHKNNGLDKISSATIKEKIREQGTDAIIDVLKLLLRNNSNFLLLADQFEELFRFCIDNKDLSKKDEAIDFVNILLELSKQTELPIYVIITMRSDFIGDCAQFYGLPEAMNQSQYIVPRLNRIQLENIIEAPIRLYSGNINPALTARLLNDSHLVKDELPLLQHALMRIWETEKIIDHNGELDLGDYKRIGGIEKALSNHADEALRGMSAAELDLTKKIFQALTAIDENGRKIRRPAHISELHEVTGADTNTLLSIIDCFIEGNKNFLVKNKINDENDLLIDISHESLIRQWNKLDGWVDEEAESAKMFLRLSEATRLYQQKKKDLLARNELNQMLQWFYSFKPNKLWAQRYNSEYENNIQYLKESEKEEKKQRSIKLRNRRLLVAALIVVIIIISAFAYSIYQNDIRNKKALALNYWQSGQSAKAENNLLDGLHLVAEAAVVSNDKDLIQKFLIDGEVYLPYTRLNSIIPQKDIINSVAFNVTSDRILIASNDGTARIIDKITGDQIGSMMNNQWPVISAVFSPDNKSVLTSGNGKAVRVWDVATGKQTHVFRFDEENVEVKSAAFSPDGKLIVITSSNDSAQVWEIGTEKMLYGFEHIGVLSAVFSPDGTKILTTGYYQSNLWDVSTKKEIPFLRSARNPEYAAFSPDGTMILAISNDSTVRIWDINENQLASFKHDDAVTDAVFSPDNKLILTASRDKSARLWNIGTQKQIGTTMKHDGPIYCAAFSPDGKQILTAGWDKTIRLWDIKTRIIDNNFLAKVPGGGISRPWEIKMLDVGDDSTALAIGDDSTVYLWNLVSRKQIRSLKHPAGVNSAVFNADGTKVLTTCNDSTIRIWETANGKPINFLKLEDQPINAVFNAKGKLILAVFNYNYIQIWDAALTPMAKPIHTFTYREFYTAVFSPDERTILIASVDSAAHLLDASSGKLITSFKHDNIVRSAVFSADGKKVLTAGEDFTARVWDVNTGKQVGPSMRHDNNVNDAAFSPDGKWIVTASWDKAAHLWDAVTLKEIGVSKKHEGAVTNAVFSRDSKWILTVGYDSTVKLWDIAGDLDMPPSLFKLQAMATTGVGYNMQTGETNCIPIQEWKALKEEYNNRGRKHYKNCKYRQHNLWRRFNSDDAEKIHPE